MAEDFVPLPTIADVKANPTLGADVVTNMDARVRESYNRMTSSYSDGGWDLANGGIRNFSLYLHGHRGGINTHKYRMNMIQGACIANAAIQAGDRPQTQFKPRESGEPSKCYINTKLQIAPNLPVMKMVNQILAGHPEALRGIQANGQKWPEPLSDDEAAQLKMLVDQGRVMKMQAMASGQAEPVNILPDDFLIEVNDYTEAQAAQEMFDIYTEKAAYSRAIVENVLYNTVMGMQPFRMQFDDELRRHFFTNPEFLTVYIDPFKTDISQAAYCVVDDFMDADEAKQRYPKLADAIEKNATMGPPTRPGYTPSQTPLPWFQAFMGRKVVIIREGYIRNQVVPLTPEDAIKRGKVVKQDVPDIKPPIEPEGDNPDHPGFIKGLINAGKKLLGGTSEQAETPAAEATEPARVQSQEMAAGTEATPEPGVPTRPAMFLVGDDGQPDMSAEVDPTHPSWPVKRGIARCQIIASTLVSYEECDRLNIPIGWNVNIPILYTPYGQGEPERLEPLQQAYNQTLNDIIEHGQFSAFPANLMPQSVVAAHPELARKKFVQPGVTYPVQDRLYTLFGEKILTQLKPGELPADAWKRESVLFDRFEKLSDQSAVLRGEQPDQSPSSGVAIGQLQGAAKTTIVFKAERLRDMLVYNAGVILYDLVNRIPVDVLAEQMPKYPKQVFYELHRRLLDYSLDASITVSVTGSSNGTQAHKQLVIQAANTPKGQQTISNDSFLDALDMDPEIEMMNTLKASRTQAQMAPQAAPGKPAPAAQAPAAPQPPQ